MKKVITSIACVLLLAMQAYAQTAPAGIKEPASRLKAFFDKHEIEKVYLHFDKPYYAGGDTIYFKAYVMAGEKNTLSPLSGVLYADLINPQSKVVNTIKLPIYNGLAWGDFALTDSVAGGKYRIRAYTKLMLSYGHDLIFEKTLPVAAIEKKRATGTGGSRVVENNTNDIQFLPEGGQLVPGVRSKVAFKALRSDGTGIAASGVVVNRINTVIANFSTTRLGMGLFNFTPKAGENYYAKVTFADSSKVNVALPAADSSTVALSISNLAGKLAIVLRAGDGFFHAYKNQPVSLLFYAKGKLTTYADKLTNREMKFDLEKSRLPSGITQITLLAANGIPVCERLVFIDNNDHLNIGVLTDKPLYQPRGLVNVKLHVDTKDGEPVSGHFSVAVVDNAKVDVNEDKEENILTYLLLTSNLKGSIEDPGYYFNHIDDKKRTELDLVMLTHGYRRFNWKVLVDDEAPLPAVQPERTLSIAGIAKSINGKPIDNGVVTLIPVNGGSFLSEKTDKNGAFSFEGLTFYDSTRFVLNAVNAKGENNTQLIYQPELPAPIDNRFYASADTSISNDLAVYLQNSINRHNQFERYYGKGIALKEVKITALKKEKYRTQSFAGAGNADALIKGNTLPKVGMLATALAGRIGGVYFVNADSPNGGQPKMQIGNNAPMLVIVDGVQREGKYASVNDIYPGDIETIEVLKYASAAVYGMQGGNGVIIITTKQGAGLAAEDVVSRGVLPLTIKGFYRAKEFYAPRYDLINDRTRADLRSTIFWIPEISTDKSGNASFNFYNADGQGQYQVIIEGIDNNGVAGAAKLSYKVSE